MYQFFYYSNPWKFWGDRLEINTDQDTVTEWRWSHCWYHTPDRIERGLKGFCSIVWTSKITGTGGREGVIPNGRVIAKMDSRIVFCIWFVYDFVTRWHKDYPVFNNHILLEMIKVKEIFCPVKKLKDTSQKREGTGGSFREGK